VHLLHITLPLPLDVDLVKPSPKHYCCVYAPIFQQWGTARPTCISIHLITGILFFYTFMSLLWLWNGYWLKCIICAFLKYCDCVKWCLWWHVDDSLWNGVEVIALLVILGINSHTRSLLPLLVYLEDPHWSWLDIFTLSHWCIQSVGFYGVEWLKHSCHHALYMWAVDCSHH